MSKSIFFLLLVASLSFFSACGLLGDDDEDGKIAAAFSQALVNGEEFSAEDVSSNVSTNGEVTITLNSGEITMIITTSGSETGNYIINDLRSSGRTDQKDRRARIFAIRNGRRFTAYQGFVNITSNDGSTLNGEFDCVGEDEDGNSLEVTDGVLENILLEEEDSGPPPFGSVEEAEIMLQEMERILNGTRYSTSDFGLIYYDLFLSSIQGPNVVTTSPDPEILQIQNHQIDPANNVIEEVWNKSYDLLSVGYKLDERMESTSSVISSEDKSRILGESKLLQAYVYLMLNKLFGNVPIVIGDELPEQYTEQEVSAQTEFLADEAIFRLTEAGQKSRSFIGYAIKGEVGLKKQDYALAYTSYEIIMNSGSFSENLNASSVFNDISFTNPEWIWVVESEQHPDFDLLSKMTLNAVLQNEIGGIDSRRGWFDASGNVLKYGPNTGNSGSVGIYRYAEILLNAAESAANLGVFEAAQDLVNQVRERAGLDPVEVNDLTTFICETIPSEKSRELFGEGIGWQQAKDSYLYCDPVFPEISEANYLWPIPQSALETNPGLVQNAGY